MKVKVLRLDKKLPLPNYMSNGASGMDLYASIEGPIEINPGEFKLIPTGIKISIPEGFEAQVRPRSGLAAKFGVTVLNTPGTIDSDYRGEVKIILINFGKEIFKVERGMRVAQMVFMKVERITFDEVEDEVLLDITKRNSGGFGHTGI
ncbi:MAG TPA: dUTP diphosphatase [candidate division WOR-3 bacterium]|uniref:Deoxyuridine 5'-triphosphate nucleotidohydrolase n=1 Tax=candidate division WOR-3 bacterium TaxID=2052148 RepID=A0A7C5DAN0_UNCW3|nr:dUTP diphosphatase [candidate division WOR-3 bacterium]